MDFCYTPPPEMTVFVKNDSGRIPPAGTTCFGHGFSDEVVIDLQQMDS